MDNSSVEEETLSHRCLPLGVCLQMAEIHARQALGLPSVG